MMKKRIFIAALAFISILASCKSQYDLILSGNDIDAKYDMAFKLFESGKYAKAAELFESASLAVKGTEQDDTVQFYLGLSNYKYKDYTTAESNLKTFVETFPLSPFTDQARYLYLDCLFRGTYRYELDQTPTYKALTEMNVFKIEHPDSQYIKQVDEMIDDLNARLELKAYKSAYLYFHTEDYLAAHYALKNVLKENADNRYRDEILYYTALSSYKYAANSISDKQRERYLTFVDDYFNVVSEIPDSEYAKNLEPLYVKVQKILKKTDTENE